MTTYVMLYEGFMNFEIVISMHLLKTGGEVKTMAMSKDALRSGEGLNVLPDMLLNEVVLEEEDVVLIPGGAPGVLDGEEEFYAFLRQADAQEVLLAAICAAPTHLAKAGVLKDREYTTSIDPKGKDYFDVDMFVKENVVVDGHIVTAQPSGYVELGIVLGQIMDIYENKEDFEETVRFFMDYEIQ